MYQFADDVSNPDTIASIRDKWFHGTASRNRVEALVKKGFVNGSFAVRLSESIAGAYTLSLLYNHQVYTYRILPTPCGNMAVQTNDGVQRRRYRTIDELILQYRKPDNGLMCALTNPVGRSDHLAAYDKAK